MTRQSVTGGVACWGASRLSGPPYWWGASRPAPSVPASMLIREQGKTDIGEGEAQGAQWPAGTDSHSDRMGG